MELKALLQEMIDKKASDVFIVAGLPLTYTADGRQVRMDMAPLMPADTKELVDAIYSEMAEFGFLTRYIYADGIEEININSWRDIEVQYSDGRSEKLIRFRG